MPEQAPLDPRDAASWSEEDYERYAEQMKNVISFSPKDLRDQRNDYCERCGGARNDGIIWGHNTRRCGCEARFAQAHATIRRIDPEGEMTFFDITDPHPSAQDAARKLAALAEGERERGVFMFGLPGRGKTHLSVATARRLLERGRLVGLYNLAGLVGRVQDTYGYDDSSESRAKIVREVTSNDAVILDDIGKEHRSSNVESIVYEIVDGLYNARVPLIASSNLPGKDFVSRYDGAVLSRLGGMCEKLVIRGEDRRASKWDW